MTASADRMGTCCWLSSLLRPLELRRPFSLLHPLEQPRLSILPRPLELRRPFSLLCLLCLLCLVCLALDGAVSAAHAQTPHSRVEHPGTLLAEDVRQGLEISVMLSEAIGLHENPEWEERLATIGHQVASVSEDAHLPYNFHILEMPEPNAMALPGGFIFVTRGMFEIDLTDDELAHLIGHEIAHVHMRHFVRAARLNTLFSVLQTALMVGILMGVPETSAYGGQRVEVAEDPGLREWSVGTTGKQALLEGTTLLGSIARALFEKGYSRKLEFEADEMGSRLAVKAGFPPEGGPAMLERLHERSYEGNRFSYWRTHPYFHERVIRAQSRAARLRPPETPPDDNEYRQRLALFFATAAEQMPNEKAALFLYQCALQAQPEQLASFPAALDIARFKKAREERRHPLLRSYSPLIAEYDSIITHADRELPDWDKLAAAREERDSLAKRRQDLLDDYMEVFNGESSSTGFLERFLANYPDHPQVPEMTCLLGLHYQLSGHADEAVRVLEPFLAEAPAGVWADSARSVLVRAIEEIEDLTICYRLLETYTLPAQEPGAVGDGTHSGAARDEPHPALGSSEHAELARAARERMDQLVAGDLALDQGARFLQNYPQTTWTAQVQEKVRKKARERLEHGRVQEGLHRYQDALDAYFTILALVPDSPAALEADASIDRIHRLEAVGSSYD